MYTLFRYLTEDENNIIEGMLNLKPQKRVAIYDYVQVNELPNEIRTSFISEHRDEQLISNKLIEYVTSNCFDE